MDTRTKLAVGSAIILAVLIAGIVMQEKDATVAPDIMHRVTSVRQYLKLDAGSFVDSTTVTTYSVALPPTQE